MASPSQQFIDIGKENFVTLMRFTDLSLQGAARVFKAQTDCAKEVFAESAKNLKAIQNGETQPAQALSVYRTAVEKSWDLTRDFIESATQTQSELSQMMSEQMSKLNEGVSRNLDQLNQWTQRASEQVQQAAREAGDEAQRTTQRAAKR
jgi:hypothetical protein